MPGNRNVNAVPHLDSADGSSGGVDPVFELPVAGPFDPRAFTYSIWSNCKEAYNGKIKHGMESLFSILETSGGMVQDKRNLPILGFYRTTDGHRHGKKLETVTGIGIDCDGGESFERLKALLIVSGLAFLLYESTSNNHLCEHNPEGKPCWRVVLLLAEPLPASACGSYDDGYYRFKRAYHHIISTLWMKAGYDLRSLDTSVCDPGRGWYPGSRPTETAPPRLVLWHPGLGLDGWAILESASQEYPQYRGPGTPAKELGDGTPLEDDICEQIAQDLAPSWRTVAGRHHRHDASLALGRLLRIAGLTREDAVGIVNRLAELAGDSDEIEHRDRSQAAADGWDRPGGYGWPWLRKNLPEVAEGLDRCLHLRFRPEQHLRKDLEPDESAIRVNQEQALSVLRDVVASASSRCVEVLEVPADLSLPAAVAAERANKGLHTAILVQNYEDLWGLHDMLVDWKLDVRVLLGTTAIDQEREPYCTQFRTARELGQGGFNVRQALCKNCEDADDCPVRKGRIGPRKAMVTIGLHWRFPDVVRRLHRSGIIIAVDGIKCDFTRKVQLDVLNQAAAASGRLVAESTDIKNAYAIVSNLAQACTERKWVQTWDVVNSDTGRQIAVQPMWSRHLCSQMNGNDLRILAAAYPVIQTLLDNEGGVFEFQPAEVQAGKETRGSLLCSFRSQSMIKALRSQRLPLVVIGEDGDAATIHKYTGREIRELPLEVYAPAAVTRILLQASNSTQRRLIRGGRVDHSKLVGTLRRIIEQIEAYPPLENRPHVKVLLVSHGQVVKDFERMVTDDPLELNDPGNRVREILRCFQEAHPEWALHFAKYYTPVSGDMTDCNVCVTVGDPWPNVNQAERNRARLRGGPTYDSCRERVRSELRRLQSALSTTGRTDPILLIHAGEVGPKYWCEANSQWRVPRRGRPQSQHGIT